MKDQIFGVSRLGTSLNTTTVEEQKRIRQCMLSFLRAWHAEMKQGLMIKTYGWCRLTRMEQLIRWGSHEQVLALEAAGLEAVQDYIKNRMNMVFPIIDGLPDIKRMIPELKLPFDGAFSFENPNAPTSRIIYTEGPQDKAWMEEQDRIYLAQQKAKESDKPAAPAPSTTDAQEQDAQKAKEEQEKAKKQAEELAKLKQKAPNPPQQPPPVKSWHIEPVLKPVGRDWPGYPYITAGKYDRRKVKESYRRCPVPGMKVGKVTIIFDPILNKSFSDGIELLEKRHGKPVFQPHWNAEGGSQEDLDWRAEVSRRLDVMAAPYSDAESPHVKILSVWHGTKRVVVDSLVETGFANLALTDSGFFGKGLYSSYEAEYAYRVYGPGKHKANGVLLINWIACYSAYPVIDGDMPKLKGKGNYANYDAHFVPVKPADPTDPDEVCYYPCRPKEKATYHEIVVFEKTQILPRYIVELKPSKAPAAASTAAPAPSTTASSGAGLAGNPQGMFGGKKKEEKKPGSGAPTATPQ